MARNFLERTINLKQITRFRTEAANTVVNVANFQPQTEVLLLSSTAAGDKPIVLPVLPYITDLTISTVSVTAGSYSVTTAQGVVTLDVSNAAVTIRSTGDNTGVNPTWELVGLSGGAWISGTPSSPMTTSVRIATLVGTGATFAPLPTTGRILRMTLSLQGALTTGNATVQAAILPAFGGAAVDVTGGLFTLVQAGSGAGQTYSIVPTALNVISAVTNVLRFTVGGTNDAVVGADIVTVIG